MALTCHTGGAERALLVFSARDAGVTERQADPVLGVEPRVAQADPAAARGALGVVHALAEPRADLASLPQRRAHPEVVEEATAALAHVGGGRAIRVVHADVGGPARVASGHEGLTHAGAVDKIRVARADPAHALGVGDALRGARARQPGGDFALAVAQDVEESREALAHAALDGGALGVDDALVGARAGLTYFLHRVAHAVVVEVTGVALAPVPARPAQDCHWRELPQVSFLSRQT